LGNTNYEALDNSSVTVSIDATRLDLNASTPPPEDFVGPLT